MTDYVVTSFNNDGYALYGRRFLQTFLRYWPPSVRLIVAHEDVPELPANDVITYVNLCDDTRFDTFTRQNYTPIARGRQRAPGAMWKIKAIHAGYNYRFDALKFGKKILGLQAGAAHALLDNAPASRLFWFDADIVTHTHVPIGALDGILPPNYHIGRLYRPPPGHSECGIVGYALSKSPVQDFIAGFATTYINQKYQQHEEWHDSWIFDRLIECDKRLMCYNIAHRSKSHPLVNSFLAEYFDHLKGAARKQNGTSFDYDYV